MVGKEVGCVSSDLGMSKNIQLIHIGPKQIRSPSSADAEGTSQRYCDLPETDLSASPNPPVMWHQSLERQFRDQNTSGSRAQSPAGQTADSIPSADTGRDEMGASGYLGDALLAVANAEGNEEWCHSNLDRARNTPDGFPADYYAKVEKDYSDALVEMNRTELQAKLLMDELKADGVAMEDAWSDCEGGDINFGVDRFKALWIQPRRLGPI